MRYLRLQVQLQTVFVDIEKQGKDADQEFNREILSELVEEIRHKDIVVQTPAELLGIFKCKEYSNTAYYAGPFTVGPNMNIRVKVRDFPWTLFQIRPDHCSISDAKWIGIFCGQACHRFQWASGTC